MSSYLSNLLTHTTSRYASLRRTLLSTEDDGDTPDDTHICRVLRAYYTEKNRAFPDWLPPDPNKKVAAQQQQQPAGGYGNMTQSSTWGRGQVGALRGEGREPVQRASLSDLWDAPAGGTTAPQSLRAARRPMQNPAANASVGGLAPPPVQGRPLPSQRAGSYQSVASQSSINLGGYGGAAGNRPGSGTSFESGNGGGTAQERLKARLWGAARTAGAGGGGGGGGGGGNEQDDGGRRYGR